MGQCRKGQWYDNSTLNQKNVIKIAFGKIFAIPLKFDFFGHPVCPNRLKEGLIVILELNSSEKWILGSGDAAATCKFSGKSLEYDAKFDESYTRKIGELCAGIT